MPENNDNLKLSLDLDTNFSLSDNTLKLKNESENIISKIWTLDEAKANDIKKEYTKIDEKFIEEKKEIIFESSSNLSDIKIEGYDNIVNNIDLLWWEKITLDSNFSVKDIRKKMVSDNQKSSVLSLYDKFIVKKEKIDTITDHEKFEIITTFKNLKSEFIDEKDYLNVLQSFYLNTNNSNIENNSDALKIIGLINIIDSDTLMNTMVDSQVKILTNEFNMRVRFLPGINRYWTSLSGINRYWTSLVTRGLNSNLKTALKSWGFVKYNQLITEFTQKYKLDVDIETLKKINEQASLQSKLKQEEKIKNEQEIAEQKKNNETEKQQQKKAEINNSKNINNQTREYKLNPNFVNYSSWHDIYSVSLKHNTIYYRESDWKPKNIKVSNQEKEIIQKNPETIKNIVDLQKTCSDLKLWLLYENREEIFKALKNKYPNFFDQEDNYLNPKEQKIFLTQSMKTLWFDLENDLKTTELQEKIKELNLQSNIIKQEEVNNKWDSKIEAKFRENFLDENLKFKFNIFEQSLKVI